MDLLQCHNIFKSSVLLNFLENSLVSFLATSGKLSARVSLQGPSVLITDSYLHVELLPSTVAAVPLCGDPLMYFFQSKRQWTLYLLRFCKQSVLNFNILPFQEYIMLLRHLPVRLSCILFFSPPTVDFSIHFSFRLISQLLFISVFSLFNSYCSSLSLMVFSCI